MADKGLDRGGTLGNEGEISGPQRGGPGNKERNEGNLDQRKGNLDQRDQQRQRGGISREPNLEKKPIPDTRPVD